MTSSTQPHAAVMSEVLFHQGNKNLDSPTKKCPFDEDYYMRGVETGKSNYQNYRWLPELTIPMVESLKRHLHIQDGDYVLDFGCGPGMLVKAMRMCGVHAVGYDISKWAIENCDESVKHEVSNDLALGQRIYDFIIAKDVMEHIPVSQLKNLIPGLCDSTRKSILIIVPLTSYRNGDYIRKEDEADITHVIRYTLDDWLRLLTPLAPDFTVSGSYHINGLKPASIQVPCSCGFFTLQRSA